MLSESDVSITTTILGVSLFEKSQWFFISVGVTSVFFGEWNLSLEYKP